MTSNARNKKSRKADLGEDMKKGFHKEAQKNNERLYAVFDSMLEGVQILGHDWRYVYLNASAEVHNRRPNRELLGNIYMEMWPGIEDTHVFTVIKKCMEARVPSQLENRFAYPDGMVGWFMLSIQPVPEGVLILSYDITKRARSEKQAMQMKRLYATLSQVNQTIVRVRETQKLYQTICDVAVRFGEFSLAWIGLLDETSGEVRPVAANGLDVAQWPFPTVNIQKGALKDGLISRAIRTSKVLTSDDIQTDKRLKNLYSQLKEYAYHSSAAVPFRLMEKTIGVLSLVSPEEGLFKAEEEMQLLEEMGLDISFALDTIESEAERGRAEGALRASESRYRELVQNANSAIIRWAYDGSVSFINEYAQDLFGYKSEQIVGKHIGILLPETESTGGDLTQLVENIAANPDQFVNVVNENICQGGRRVWMAWTNKPIVDEQGKVKEILAVGMDITARKHAEEKLQASERTLKLFVEYAPAAIAMFDRDMKYIAASRRFIEDYRLAEQNIIGHSHYEIFPEISERWKEIHRRCLAGATESAEEDPFPRTDGTLDWVRWEIHPWYEQTGEIGGIILFSEVITERKQAEEERENLARFPGENPNPVMRLSRDGLIIYANAASHSLLCEWASEVGGHAPDYWRELVADSIDSQTSQTVDIQHGENVLSIFVVPIPEAGYTNLYGSDITDRKRYEEELRTLNTELEQRVANRTQELVQANIELEHANRAKDEFLATMSHELRTPLNSILGLSESLLEQRRGSLNERQQKLLHTIESSGRHLLELINDVLDLSKIEAGKFDYYPQVVDVDALCRSSLAFVKEQALHKSIALTHKKDSAGIRMYADSRRLKQILVNLLTNAVKFTPDHGKVTLRVKTDAEEDLVQFVVTDNGIGIAPDDLEKLFQPFVQVDSRLNRQFEGTGLGLALVQKLTDLHGGSVQVESEVGVGSRFTINLPWGRQIMDEEKVSGVDDAQLTRKQSGESLDEPHERRTILLAEDNMPNILTIGEYLESHGYEIVVAHDGWEALDLAGKTDPDLILMDIQMPSLDGLEATRRLRIDSRFTSTPIIALTALAMPGDRERCLEAGANEYMSKPVSLKGLVKTIKKLTARSKDK